MPLLYCVGAVSEREERNHAQQKCGLQESRIDTKTLFLGLLMLIASTTVPMGQTIRVAKHRWPK